MSKKFYLWGFNGRRGSSLSVPLGHYILITRQGRPLGLEGEELQFIDYFSQVKRLGEHRMLYGNVCTRVAPAFPERVLFQMIGIAPGQVFEAREAWVLSTSAREMKGTYALLAVSIGDKFLLEVESTAGEEFVIMKKYGDTLLSAYSLGKKSIAQETEKK